MARPYSIDLHERVIAAVAEGQSVRAVGEIFDVSPSFVAKLAQRWRRSGRIDPLISGGDRRSGAIEAQRDWLLQTIEQKPDLTLRVERFFARVNRNRRLAKDFEATITSATAFLYAACVMLLARRLARSA
jgi:transposase